MCVCAHVVIMMVIRRILCMYNRSQIMESSIHHAKEFRLHFVDSGKAINNSWGRDMHVWCVIKTDDVNNVKDRLEENKHSSRRPVKGHYNCSGCADFQFNGLIFVGRYKC